QRRCEHLLDIGAEPFAVDRPIDDEGSSEPIAARAGDESRRLPTTVGDGADEALASRTAAIAAYHVGGDPGLVEEDETNWEPPGCPTKPRGPPPCPAGSARRHEATFLSRRPRRSSVRHRQPRLTVTPRSPVSQSCNSASVASGSAPRRVSNACSWPASLRGGRPHGIRAAVSPVLRRRMRALY